MQRVILRQKQHDVTCWVYDHFCSLQQAKANSEGRDELPQA